jgi:hypothetical protein
MASQYRLLPLGRLGSGELVALELDQFRGGPPGKVTWKVSPRLVALSGGGGRRVIQTYRTASVERRSYVKGLAPLYRTARRDARALSGLSAIKLTEHLECEYLDACLGHRVSPGKREILLRPKGARKAVPVKIPPLFARHVNARPHLDLPEAWTLAAVRSFSLGGGRRAVVFTLVTGTDKNPCTFAADPKCQDDRRPLRRKPIAGMFHQPALHHGHDFDVVIWR